MQKPLTLEFYGMAQKNKNRMHTECKECKLKYMKQWQSNKRLSKDPETKREKHMYTIKEYTEEEKQQRLTEAYAYIYYQSHGRPITKKILKEIEGIEE
jgi:hypothetical protein